MVSMLFPPNFGGAAVQSLRLAKGLTDKGLNVEFVADNGAQQTVINDSYEGITVARLKTYSNDIHSKFRELMFCIKLFLFVISRPDIKIIHFHSVRGFELFLFPFFRMIGKKILLKLTLVDSDDPLTFKRRRLLSPLYMWGLKAAHSMAAISEELKHRAIATGIEANCVHKIFNGFDEKNFFIPDDLLKKTLRKQLQIDESALVFLSIGKVEHRKGYDLLIESFFWIQQKLPNAQLLIVGPGNDERNVFYNELCKSITEKKLRNVIFVGKKNNIHEYTKAVDAFLFCSRQEGFGTVLIEAMACGLPTLAMNIEGVTEDIITDFRTSGINYSHQPEDFAKDALELIHQADKQHILKATEELKQRFSITNIADQYVNLYRSIL